MRAMLLVVTLARVASAEVPAPSVTAAQCIKAMYPDAKAGHVGGELVGTVEVIPLGRANFACRVDHHPAHAQDTFDTTTELGVMQPGKPMRAGRISSRGTRQETAMAPTWAVAATQFPLTVMEAALLVDEIAESDDPDESSKHTHSTLYLATASGLAAVLAFDSSASAGYSVDSDTCTLVLAKTTHVLMPDLDLRCVHVEQHDVEHNYVPKTSTHVAHYRWNGTVYVKS